MVIFEADGAATLSTKRCRDSAPGVRVTFRQVKQGRLRQPDFVRLSQLVENNHFFSMRPRYYLNPGGTFTTDRGVDDVRVAPSGRNCEVRDWNGTVPADLWTIEMTIEGISASMDWDGIYKQPKCPPWEKPKDAEETHGPMPRPRTATPGLGR